MNRRPLLSIRNVTHRYGETLALDDVSLDIGENEFFALLGPSGCGKTTLLRAIAGFETPAEGDIELDGSSLIDVPANRRPINLMFQSYALFPHMTVEKNVAYGLETERLGKAEIAERVHDVLTTVGLTALARKRPSQLSGGQRQRVALARAIVKRPRLLLLDEPLSALDRQVRQEMQFELKRLQHEVGLTFVVVTHDQEEAMSMADRIALLDRGRVSQVDAPEVLYARPATRFVAAFIGSATLLDGTFTENGITTRIGDVALRHDFDPGSAGSLVLRPEAVRLHAPGDGRVDGTLVDTTFYGGTTIARFDLGDSRGIVHATVPTGHTFVRGSRYGMSWRDDDTCVVPGSASRAQEAST